MIDRLEYLRRALNAEHTAMLLPAGFERDKLLRRAAAYFEVADTLERLEFWQAAASEAKDPVIQ